MKLFVVTLLLLFCLANSASAQSKPNIVYFLVDDLGYSDCGFNGGTDIRTLRASKGTIYEGGIRVCYVAS